MFMCDISMQIYVRTLFISNGCEFKCKTDMDFKEKQI